MKKCYICEDEEVKIIFTNTRGVKHYYCKECAKKYIINLSRRKLKEIKNGSNK